MAVIRLDVVLKILVNSLVVVDGRLRRVIMRSPPNSLLLSLELLMSDGHHHGQENQSNLHLEKIIIQPRISVFKLKFAEMK